MLPRTATGDADPKALLAWLRLLGHTRGTVAARAGVDPSMISHVINGTAKSRRIERAIARTLGVAPKVLWPGRYNTGSRRR